MIARISSIIDVILMFLLIISTNSIYVNIEDSYNFSKYITILIFISFLCKILLVNITRRLFNNILFSLVVYYSVVILISIINITEFTLNNILYYFINFPLLVVILILINEQNQLKEWLIYYINITILLSVVSLFFWILGSNLNIISSTDYLINKWSDGGVAVSYYNIYFETQRIAIMDNVIIRNSGIFAEAPMWNLILSIALMIQTLFLGRNNYKTFILVLTILSTVSTTGIYVIGLIIAYKIIFEVSGWKKYIALTLVPILLLVLSFVWENKSETASASIRFDDFYAGIKAWSDSIFFGSGFSSGLRVIESYMDTTIRANLGYSNSLFLILAQGGIILLVLYLLPMILIFVKRKYSYDTKFFIILLIVIFSTTIFVDTYIFAFIIGFTYSIVLIGELDEKNNRRI